MRARRTIRLKDYRTRFVAAPAALALAACATAADVSGMNFVDAAGVRTHAEAWGPEGAPGVLLIHGASSDMAVFAPSVIPALQARYRIVAYDRPGMGFSAERPRNAQTLKVQADVAAGVIDAMKLRKPIVIAHSYGGAVALRLALDHPDKVGGLVLIAPVAYRWPGGVSWHVYWSSNPVVGGLFNHVVTRPFVEAAMRAGMTAAFAPSLVPDGYFEAAAVERAGRPAAMRASAADVAVLKREVTAQEARYGEIGVPVGILTGVGDTVVSPTIHSLALSNVLETCRLYLLEGVGHLPHEAAPEKLAELVEWVSEKK